MASETTVETQTSIEPTVEQLRTANEELQRRKVDAEKDRELFRELYAKASSHVSEVTKENNELLEKVTLLEGKLNEGLALIRATYEERIRRLEEDAARWKGLYELQAEKDRRTGGDDIRQRAALEPEIRAENLRLKDELDVLTAECERLERLFGQREPEPSPSIEPEKILEGSVQHVDEPQNEPMGHWEGVIVFRQVHPLH